MHAASAQISGCWIAGFVCSCKLAEPRTDGRKSAHEATCLQKLAAPTSSRRQIAVEIRLIDIVHIQQTIGGAVVESAVFNVIAENADAFLVAASK